MIKPVVIAVANFRLRHHVIRVVVPADFLGELGVTLFGGGVRHVEMMSAGAGKKILFGNNVEIQPLQSAYKDYFASHAEAWEGITYMKARAVAGKIERGTAFLNDLQQLDWRRYGQSGRSRTELALMRARLEKEQGGRNPLKAGPGGYYDIDFVDVPKAARRGMFYKVLNSGED